MLPSVQKLLTLAAAGEMPGAQASVPAPAGSRSGAPSGTDGAGRQGALRHLMPRLFTGIEIPAPVATALSFVRGGLPGARWIDPDLYHVTLRFIGDIDQPVAREIAERLRPSVPAAVPAHRGRAGCSRVLRAVSSRADPARIAPEPELIRPSRPSTSACCSGSASRPSRESSKPHVTLARFPRAAPDQEIPPASSAPSRRLRHRPPFPAVDRFVLFSARADHPAAGLTWSRRPIR